MLYYHCTNTTIQEHPRLNSKNLEQHDTDSSFITGEAAISAHRSGAGFSAVMCAPDIFT